MNYEIFIDALWTWSHCAVVEDDGDVDIRKH